VLKEIGADQVPQILVFNKMDALAADAQPVRAVDTYEIDGQQCPRVFISARAMTGLQSLRECLSHAASLNGSPPQPLVHVYDGLSETQVPLSA